MAVTKKDRVYKLTAAADVITDVSSVLVRGLKWVGPGAVGNAITVTSGGSEFWSSVCAAINQGDDVWFPTMPYECKNLTASVLTGGYLLVYVD